MVIYRLTIRPDLGSCLSISGEIPPEIQDILNVQTPFFVFFRDHWFSETKIMKSDTNSK